MRRSPSRLTTKARGIAERFGRRGETLAAWYLRAKFYRILARRVKTPLGEIDLVASRFGVTVFVEVKARQSRELEYDALLAVNRRRISGAAAHYLARHQHLAAATRFDVIFLAPRCWPRHVMNAFDAS